MEKKNHFIRAVSVILVVLMLVTSAPLSGFVGLELPKQSLSAKAEAYDDDDDDDDEYYGTQYGNTGIYYTNIDGKVKITHADIDIVNANIPESINGDPVTEISGYDDYEGFYGAFEGCKSLESVTIPNSVTNIGSSAFNGCTSLQSVTIPDSVTSIGNSAFYNTGYYKNSNNWENGVLYIGKYLIEANESLSGSYSIKSGTRVIAANAFSVCKKLQSVTIPNSVTIIDCYAFGHCENLQSVTIPDSLTSIGYNAFIYTKYYFNSSNWENGVLYIGKYLIETEDSLSGSYSIKNGTKVIADSAFSGCASLKSVTIPNSVTNMGDYVFRDCESLQSVKIGNSVTSIGDDAFNFCANLKSVTIPNSVTSIGSTAFEDCKSLQSVTIGNSVTSIGDMAFYGCTSIKKVNITDLESWCKIDYEDFYSNPLIYSSKLYLNGELITKLVIPNGITEIKAYAFYNCENVTTVTIPNSVTSIGIYAFHYCTSLQSVTIPKSVASIGECAFYDCTSLQSVTIPKSVTSMGLSVFTNCKSLQSATIENGLTSIGCETFKDCTSLQSVTIGNSVASIEFAAFRGCKNLQSVTIPNSVTSIGDMAFCGCTGLKSVTIGNGVTNIGYDVFAGTGYYKNSSYWKNGVLYIGKYLIKANESLSGSYSIKSGTKVIADYAFFDCKKLQSVTIPESVTSIGYESFGYMYNSKTYEYELVPGFTIQGTKGSEAEKYANENKIKFVEASQVTVPAQVKSLKASAKTSSSVTLTWAKVSGASGYEVYKYSSSSKKYTKIGSTTSNTFKVSELLSSTKYMFAVRAYSTSGGKNVYGKMSSLLTVTTSKQGKPAQVAKPKVTKITATTLTLSWTKVGGADVKYYVFSYNAKTKKYTNLGSTTSNTFTAKKLKAGTKYTLVIQSYGTKSKSWGKISPSVSTATAPVAPSITVTAGKMQATVKWNKVTGATNYTVYFATSKNGKYKAAGTTTKTSLTVSKLSSGKTYYFKVIANEKLGNTTIKSAYSAVKSAKAK